MVSWEELHTSPKPESRQILPAPIPWVTRSSQFSGKVLRGLFQKYTKELDDLARFLAL